MTMPRAAAVVSAIMLMAPMAYAAAGEVEIEFAANDFLAARQLKGKDVGGTDLNDIILGGAGAAVALLLCCGVAICWRHHKEAQIDPYHETIWRYKHNVAIEVRAAAKSDSGKTQKLILPGAVLRVEDEITAKDGSKHLKLADHSGYLPETVAGVGQVMDLIPVSTFDEACKEFSGSAKKWEFFHKWGWAKYDPTISKLISAADAKNLPAVDFPPDQKGRNIIDLASMQQINMVTGVRRPIRVQQTQLVEAGSGSV